MPANFGDNKIICSGTGTFSTLATDHFTFPKIDGSVEQSLVTDGAGNIIFSGVTGGGGTITDIFDDKTPQLGGNLDLNSSDLTGTGDILITGIGNFSDKIQANSFIKVLTSPLSSLCKILFVCADLACDHDKNCPNILILGSLLCVNNNLLST